MGVPLVDAGLLITTTTAVAVVRHLVHLAKSARFRTWPGRLSVNFAILVNIKTWLDKKSAKIVPRARTAMSVEAFRALNALIVLLVGS
jgi:hypothetical protein